MCWWASRAISRSAEAAAISPLAAGLFEVPGVTGVFLGSDFVSVSGIRPRWNHIKPAILGVIMEHFLSGKPVIDEAGETGARDRGILRRSDSETVSDQELISTRVRPAVAMDGGDITFKGFRDGGVASTCRAPARGAVLDRDSQIRDRKPPATLVPGVEAVAQV